MNTLALLNSATQDSFDPFDADFSNNRMAMRMLYATPLEISTEGSLVSSLFETFNYDPVEYVVTLRLRHGLKFSDGSDVEIADVRLAILRMALKRPFFPMIKAIVGLGTWLKQSHPLASAPEGIKADGNKLTLQFDRNQPNALFRLTLEIFGVVPRNCVDLKTNKLVCKVPAFSGNYELVESKDNASIFKRRNEATAHGDYLPPALKLAYISAVNNSTALDIVDSKTVLTGWESSLPDFRMVSEKELSIRWLPKSWFTSLILNPNVAPFKDPACRLAFAHVFRRNFAKLLGGEVEGSQLTSILPGYLTLEELEASAPRFDVEKCKDQLRSHPVRWGSTNAGVTPFRKTLMMTLEDFGQEQAGPDIYVSNNDVQKSFDQNETAILGYSSGFWAQDPVGDLQMYLTPKLHEPLNIMTSDQELQGMLNNLDSAHGDSQATRLKEINQYLFSNAILNVSAHIRKFYLVKDSDLLAEPAFALSSPAPWQIFSEKR